MTINADHCVEDEDDGNNDEDDDDDSRHIGDDDDVDSRHIGDDDHDDDRRVQIRFKVILHRWCSEHTLHAQCRLFT